MTDIFFKAPVWIWPLLLVLIALGLLQSRTRAMPPLRMIIISTAMLCMSAYGVMTAFHGSGWALLAWLALLSMTLLICNQLGYPRGWQWDVSTKRLQVPGSWLPMVLYVGIFLIKFAVGALLTMRPTLAQQLNFSVPISALYGLLSGIFAARALHALQLFKRARQLAPYLPREPAT